MRLNVKSTQWIIKRLKKVDCDTAVVYRMYDEFNEKFPDTYSEESYKRIVRRARSFIKELDEDGIEIKRSFEVVEKEIPSARLSPKDIWEYQKKLSEHELSLVMANRTHSFDMHTELPIGIVLISDQHIGEDCVNYQKMEDDQKLISKCEGAYQVFIGDINNNDIKHISAAIASNTSPTRQMALMDYYFSIAGDRLLAFVKGNHDDFTDQATGLDHLDMYLSKKRIPYGNAGQVMLKFKVGDCDYSILAIHKYRFNSSFNLTHSCKRLAEKGMYNADAFVVAHNHSPSCEPFYFHQELKWAIRPGSYLISRGFERRFGYNDGIADFQMLIFYPDTKDVCCMHKLHHGLNFLKSERERYKKPLDRN